MIKGSSMSERVWDKSGHGPAGQPSEAEWRVRMQTMSRDEIMELVIRKSAALSRYASATENLDRFIEDVFQLVPSLSGHDDAETLRNIVAYIRGTKTAHGTSRNGTRT